MIAYISGEPALYALTVNWVSGLPMASCGFHLTANTLVWLVGNDRPLANASCWAYKKKAAFRPLFFVLFLI
jgi:hypothetical protein